MKYFNKINLIFVQLIMFILLCSSETKITKFNKNKNKFINNKSLKVKNH